MHMIGISGRCASGARAPPAPSTPSPSTPAHVEGAHCVSERKTGCHSMQSPRLSEARLTMRWAYLILVSSPVVLGRCLLQRRLRFGRQRHDFVAGVPGPKAGPLSGVLRPSQGTPVVARFLGRPDLSPTLRHDRLARLWRSPRARDRDPEISAGVGRRPLHRVGVLGIVVALAVARWKAEGRLAEAFAAVGFAAIPVAWLAVAACVLDLKADAPACGSGAIDLVFGSTIWMLGWIFLGPFVDFFRERRRGPSPSR